VQREDGAVRIVPISWTALKGHAELADGREGRGRLAPEAALALSKWIQARRSSP
jgi:hypothetical protein